MNLDKQQQTNSLIQSLRAIEAAGIDPGSSHQLVDEAVTLANSALISADGGCEWANHKTLEDAGYRVYAGEKDSFGWLSGCIQTRNGVLVYG